MIYEYIWHMQFAEYRRQTWPVQEIGVVFHRPLEMANMLIKNHILHNEFTE